MTILVRTDDSTAADRVSIRHVEIVSYTMNAVLFVYPCSAIESILAAAKAQLSISTNNCGLGVIFDYQHFMPLCM
nr:hypothetical protein [Raoultella terrigena]